MPQKSKIQWTKLTSNPIRFRRIDTGKVGWHCEKVSTGCAGCYSEVLDNRFGLQLPFNRKGSELVEPFVNEKELLAILKVKGPTTIFLEDMSDLFLDMIPDAMIDRVFAVMALRPDVTFQILTKRPERMARYFNERDSHLAMTRQFVNFREYTEPAGPWPLPNVHLGTSVENQETADERIPHLLKVPAAVRFLSCEPLLGSLEFSDVTRRSDSVSQLGKRALDGIDWVIVGGESGPKARPCDLAWIRSICDQCRAADVPAFVKQLGAKPVGEWSPGGYHPYHANDGGRESWRLKDSHGGDWSEWPVDLRVRELPTGIEARS